MTTCSRAEAGAWFNYPFLTLKERDNETGLDYFVARYYSNAQGRFTSVDPENAGADVSDPQSWNGYVYTRNAPTVLVDPDGREFEICYSNGDCHTYSDEQFDKLKADATQLGSVFKDNKIYNEVDGNLVATASYRRTGADDFNDFANGVFFGRGESAGLVERAPVAGKAAVGAWAGSLVVGASGGLALYYGPAVIGVILERGPTVISIGAKIEKQLRKRGWTQEEVETTVSRPYRTVKTRDTRHLPNGTRMNDPATAYVNKDGSYVVRNDRTGDIVQISDKGKPGWKSPF